MDAPAVESESATVWTEVYVPLATDGTGVAAYGRISVPVTAIQAGAARFVFSVTFSLSRSVLWLPRDCCGIKSMNNVQKLSAPERTAALAQGPEKPVAGSSGKSVG